MTVKRLLVFSTKLSIFSINSSKEYQKSFYLRITKVRKHVF